MERPPLSTEQEVTAGILHGRPCSFADATKSGGAVVETLFDFTHEINRKRRPDVTFVSNDRWPRSKPVGTRDGWLVVPNLAVLPDLSVQFYSRYVASGVSCCRLDLVLVSYQGTTQNRAIGSVG